MGQEAEDAEPVVAGNQHAAVRGPLLTVHLGLKAPACAVAAAVDPEGDGQLFRGLSGSRRPDIEIEAVLAEGRVAVKEELGRIAARRMRGLPGWMAEGIGHPDAFPRHDGLGLFPAEFPDRRGGERDAFINRDALLFGRDTLDPAAFDGQDRVGIGAGGQRKNRRT